MLVKHIETVDGSLHSIAIVPGQYIIVTDTKDSYLDTSENTRIKISDFIILGEDSDRTGLLAPLTGKFYFVINTKSLWYYNAEWLKVTGDDVDLTAYLDKATYKGSADGIVKKADEAVNIAGAEQAPLFSVYMKDKYGSYGWKPFPVSISKDDLNNYSATILDAKANTTYEISLREDNEFCDLICQVYKYVEGESDLVQVIKNFNNTEAANFNYNPEMVSFENGMHIKNKYNIEVGSNADSLFESVVIDKTKFKEIYDFE